MKTSYIYSLLFISVFTGSCVKKYSCKCTTTLTASGYYPKTTETIEPIGKRTTKKKAQQMCDHSAKQIKGNSSELYADWIDVASKCELKDY